MAARLRKLARRWAALSGAAALALLARPAEAQQPAPPPPAVKPAPPAPPAAPPPDLDLASADAAATGGEMASLAAPNMIGNLLGAGRSVQFFVNRTSGASFINAVGSTSLVNPAVADNNSPVPQDRVYFRYNHFADALAVTGASAQPTMPLPGIAGARQGFTTTRTYDDDQYTFGFEKTFFERRASLEFRFPFSTTLANQLDLSYGALTSNAQLPSRVMPAQPPILVYQNPVNTPANTLGHEATQLGNLSLIFKWLFLQRSGLFLSGGAAAGIPTSSDTRIRVTDFLGSNPTEVDTLRIRDFHIRNQTWSLSPYLAALATPTDRFFTQGFVQFDVPLNTSSITYSEVVQQTTSPATMFNNGTGVLAPPFTVHDHLREQYLLHLDIGTGYWLLRRADPAWLTGFAPAAELHYTSTLNNANIVALPGDSSLFYQARTQSFQNNPPPPLVGNLRNRVDLLDLTLGTTFEFAQRARLATAFSLPLRGSDNRTYDWEFHLQLNYYFGGSRLPPAPNF